MKRTMFGEAQAEPDDDLTAIFEEERGNSGSLESVADEFSDEEHMGGWNAEVRNAEGDSIVVRGFASEQALRDYLTRHGVDVV